MADNNEILAALGKLEADLANTYALSGDIKDALKTALTANAALELENNRLRDRLEVLEAGGESDAEHGNVLQKAYDDGFHVCHQYYGKKLEAGETCLLCQEVLYR